MGRFRLTLTTSIFLLATVSTILVDGAHIRGRGASSKDRVSRRQQPLGSHGNHVGPRPCEELATAFGDLMSQSFNLLKYASGGYPVDLAVIEDAIRNIYSEFIPTFDLFDQEEREHAFCMFEDVQTLSGFLAAEETLGLDVSEIRLVYNYMVLALRELGAQIQSQLHGPHGPSISGQDWEFVRLQEQLLVDLAASGFLNLDNTGTEALIDYARLIMPPMSLAGLFDFNDVPLSTLSIQEQCSLITNDLRKVWNNVIKEERQYNPTVSQQYRETIRMFTGIQMTDHQTIRGHVCDFIEAGSSAAGLTALIELVKEMQIPDRVLKFGYPFIQSQYQAVIQILSLYTGTVGGPPGQSGAFPKQPYQKRDAYPDVDIRHYLYNVTYEEVYAYGGSGGNWEQPEELAELYDTILVILTKIQEMGLLELNDDIILQSRR